jgi:FolB domain-containing protein
MDKIFIRNLQTLGILGVNESERNSPREIIISLDIFGDFQETGKKDDIRLGVDYSQVAREVINLVEKSHRFTIEALAEDIACLCLKIQAVQEVLVRVEKPGALKVADTVGVEILRRH